MRYCYHSACHPVRRRGGGDMASYMNFPIRRKRKRYEKPKDYTTINDVSDDDIYSHGKNICIIKKKRMCF